MARGLIVLSAGRATAMVLQLVAFAMLASYLRPERLGVYAFAVAFASLFRLVPNFGLQPVITREVSQNPEREAELVANVVYLRVALGLLAYAALTVSVFVAGYTPENRQGALIAGILLVLLAIDSFRSALEVRLRLAVAALADVLEAALTLLGVVVLAHAKAGVLAFVWLHVATNMFNALVVLAKALRLAHFAWRPRLHLWWPVLKAATPIGLAGLFGIIYYRMDIVLLARLKSSEDVGQYGAAYRILEAGFILAPLLMTVVTPVLARSFAESHETLQQRYQRLMHVILLVVLPVAVAGAMTAWRVLPAVPSFAGYSGAGVCLAILAPALAMMVLGTAVQAVLINGHLQGRLLAISATGAALNLALILALIPPFSYIGASVGTTLTETAVFAYSLLQVHRRLGLRWEMASLRRALLPSVVMLLVLIAAHRLHPFVQLGLGTVTYLLALVPTRALIWEDLGGLLNADGIVTLVVGTEGQAQLDHLEDGPPWKEAGRVVLLADTPSAQLGGALGSVPEHVYVVKRRVMGTWRALRGSRTCLVLGLEGVPMWLPVMARLAACHEVVVVTGPVQTPVARRPMRLRFLDGLWSLLVDRVLVASEREQEALQTKLPRLARLSEVLVGRPPASA